MLDAATRPPSGCLPVAEYTEPSGWATVFIAMPFTIVIRSVMSARSPMPGPSTRFEPEGHTSSNVRVPSASGASTQRFTFDVSVFSVDAGWMMPRASLRGSAQSVTSHPPAACTKTKNSVPDDAATSASARREGGPPNAASVPADRSLRNVRRVVMGAAPQ